MKKPMTKSGKCEVCTINCWKEAGNKPVIWPCTSPSCPYPRGEVVYLPRSTTGSSMALLT